MDPLRLVAILSPPFATLTYAVPDWLPPKAAGTGMRVLVPVGGSLRAGLVMGAADGCPEGLAETDLKHVVWPAEDQPLLGADYLALVAELSRRQMVPAGRILGSVLPRGLRSAAFRLRVEDASGLVRSRALLEPRAIPRLSEEERLVLGRLWAEGRVRTVMKPLAEARSEIYEAACDPPWPLRPSAKRQMEVLDRLFDKGAATREALSRELGPSVMPILARLLDRGLVALRRPDEADEDDPPPPPGEVQPGLALTPEQAAALEHLRACLAAPGSVRLLHGITGSGKTLVYLELARACLDAGRTAMLLAPEIALAVNLKTAAQRFFPDRRVVLYHGYLSPERRERIFRELAGGGGPFLVVGTRSALFLPVRDLGLVVLDEEHDTSFKQDERLLYQAKEVAFFRVRRAGGLLVLGSATPDVKTFFAARSGQVPAVSMLRRVGESRLPAVRLVNLLDEKDKTEPLATGTLSLIKETVAAGDQAVVMINRRGYAPLMYCLECGETVRCPECQVGLTYHKGRERLVCHYCGLTRHYPSVCAKCGSVSYLPMGLGAEQLEERLRIVLPPDTGILRLDRDAARRQERLEEILRDFGEGRAKVLVGTQMLSKGHHFPNVTLVVVADGDLGLNLPDYRASERTFQLLVQVSGRAGRGEKPGQVVIQTRNPSHPFWNLVLKGDYEAFYERELESRRKYSYPPFVKLGLIRISFPIDLQAGLPALSELASLLRKGAAKAGVRVLGPAPCPLSQLRGQKRYQCLLKAQDWPAIRALYGRAETAFPPATGIRLSLDLDPVDML